jgi:Na+-translocating ferredoxin:NAD+ oxidoreductase RNF subunit RnfB
MSIKISKSKCIGCDFCVMFCPVYALSVSRDSFKCQVDRDLCTECLECIDYCPMDAIKEE